MNLQEGLNSLNQEKHKPFTMQEEEKLYLDLQNIEDSFSGRGDIFKIGGNLFIQESVQLLKNAIVLFQTGYFDCAYYSIREAIEIATILIFLSDIPLEDQDKWFSAWSSNSYFPVQKKMMDKLDSKGDVIIDMKIHMASFFVQIDEVNKKINKYVHKQGFQHFYVEKQKYNPIPEQKEAEKSDFLYFIKFGITATAVMRLAIDPFPILLMDEEILFRCFTSWTEPYKMEFVDEYIDQEIVKGYKKTEIYKDYYSYFINNEKKNMPTFMVMNYRFIDTARKKEISTQLHLMDFQDYCATQIVFCCEKVIRISCTGGVCEYSTDRAKPVNGWSWHSGQFESFEKNANPYNQPYKKDYISVVRILDEFFYMEHEIQLLTEEIQAIELQTSEITEFYKKDFSSDAFNPGIGNFKI